MPTVNPYVAHYNDITRFRLKSSLMTDWVNKPAIAGSVSRMNGHDKLTLLSRLVAIKYYRQSGCSSGSLEAANEQEKLWKSIADSPLPEDVNLPDLMAFVKNNGYFIQRKIPSTFQALLVNLSDDEKQDLMNKFPVFMQGELCEFLREATGKDWWLEINSEACHEAHSGAGQFRPTVGASFGNSRCTFVGSSVMPGKGLTKQMALELVDAAINAERSHKGDSVCGKMDYLLEQIYSRDNPCEYDVQEAVTKKLSEFVKHNFETTLSLQEKYKKLCDKELFEATNPSRTDNLYKL